MAKLKTGRCTPRETAWVKIKNLRYSQAEERREFFGNAFRTTGQGQSRPAGGN